MKLDALGGAAPTRPRPRAAAAVAAAPPRRRRRAAAAPRRRAEEMSAAGPSQGTRPLGSARSALGGARRALAVALAALASALRAARRSTTTCRCRPRSRCAGSGTRKKPGPLPELKPTRHGVGQLAGVGRQGRARLRARRAAPTRSTSPSTDGTIMRLDPANGRQVWRITAGKTLSGGVGADATPSSSAPTRARCSRSTPDGKPKWTARVSTEVDRAAARRRRRGRGVRRRRQHPCAHRGRRHARSG